MAITNTLYRIGNTVTVGSGGVSNFDFTSIPQTYTDLVLVMSVRSNWSGGNDDWKMFINNVSAGGTYTDKLVIGNGSSTSSSSTTGSPSGGQIYGGWNNESTNTNAFTSIQIYFPNYANTSYNKTFSLEGVQEYNATTAYTYMGAGIYSSTNAISRITVSSWNSTWAQYSTATLYGVKSVATSAKAAGGIISTDGTYYYHTFLTSDTFTPSQSLTADYLVVAGGGGSGQTSGGGWGGGPGGAGGYRYFTSQSFTATNYSVTVGAGGTAGAYSAGGGNYGANGGNSSIIGGSISTTSTGGGGGGTTGTNGKVKTSGRNGGSGGGAPQDTTSNSGGSGNSGGYTPVEGYAGGNGSSGSGDSNGGGGGAGGAGGAPTNSSLNGGVGGVGSSTASVWGLATNTGQNIAGTVYYAGGGGGSSEFTGSIATGGYGGGGNSSIYAAGTPNNGLTNTGGGGGATRDYGAVGYQSGAGGSGVVIIRYAK